MHTTGYNVAEGNRAISKKYKEKLLSKDKKEIKYTEKHKKQASSTRKSKEDKNQQRIKNYIKENLDLIILDERTFTVDAKFFDIYLKIRSVSEMLPSYGQLGSKEYLSCTLYSEIWGVIGEITGENYGYILERDSNAIKFNPPNLVNSEGVEYKSNYIYRSYLKVNNRYYLSKVARKNMGKNYELADEKTKKAYRK